MRKRIEVYKNLLILIPDSVSKYMNEMHDGILVLEDGILKYIGQNDALYEQFRLEYVLDLEENASSWDWIEIAADGKLIFPPFANCHCHLGMSLFRSAPKALSLESWLEDWIFPQEKKLSYEIVRAGSLLSLLELSHSGCGAIADMYYYEEANLESVLDSGLRANLSIDKKNQCNGIYTQNLKATEDFIVLCKQNEDRVKNSLHVHSLYLYDKAFYQELGEIAEYLNLPIQMHLAETTVEVETIKERFQMTPVELLRHTNLLRDGSLYAHCVHLTGHDLDILKGRNVTLVHNPASNGKLASGILDAEPIETRGIRLALGTDGAGSNDSLNMFSDLRLALFLQKLLHKNPQAADESRWLYNSTTSGYEALGFPEMAEFRIGEKADFVLYNLDTLGQAPFGPNSSVPSLLAYSGSPQAVEAMMINGKYVIKNYEHQLLDEEKVVCEAKHAYKALHK